MMNQLKYLIDLMQEETEDEFHCTNRAHLQNNQLLASESEMVA